MKNLQLMAELKKILTTYGGTKNEKLTTLTKNKYLQLMAEQITNTQNYHGVTK